MYWSALVLFTPLRTSLVFLKSIIRTNLSEKTTLNAFHLTMTGIPVGILLYFGIFRFSGHVKNKWRFGLKQMARHCLGMVWREPLPGWSPVLLVIGSEFPWCCLFTEFSSCEYDLREVCHSLVEISSEFLEVFGVDVSTVLFDMGLWAEFCWMWTLAWIRVLVQAQDERATYAHAMTKNYWWMMSCAWFTGACTDTAMPLLIELRVLFEEHRLVVMVGGFNCMSSREQQGVCLLAIIWLSRGIAYVDLISFMLQ